MSLFMVRFKASIKYYLRQVVKAYMTIWTQVSQIDFQIYKKMEISMYSVNQDKSIMSINTEHRWM